MKTPDRCEAVLYQARKTASEGSILVFGATEDPPSGLLQLLFIQSQKVNSAKFVLTEFSEVRAGHRHLASCSFIAQRIDPRSKPAREGGSQCASSAAS